MDENEMTVEEKIAKLNELLERAMNIDNEAFIQFLTNAIKELETKILNSETSTRGQI